jgi:hypothetical protein
MKGTCKRRFAVRAVRGKDGEGRMRGVGIYPVTHYVCLDHPEPCGENRASWSLALFASLLLPPLNTRLYFSRLYEATSFVPLSPYLLHIIMAFSGTYTGLALWLHSGGMDLGISRWDGVGVVWDHGKGVGWWKPENTDTFLDETLSLCVDERIAAL